MSNVEDQKMRRKDREMSEDFGLKVIDEAPFGTVSIIDPTKNVPYAIPLSIARSDKHLYFHTAKEGRKHELFADGVTVRIVFVGHGNVPDHFSDDFLDDEVAAGRAGTLLSKVFTTEYRSAIVVGTVRRVDSETEPDIVRDALYLISKKYTPDKMAYFDLAFQSGAKLTDIYEVTIDSITAKRKQFDSSGDEMKWQRTTE